MIDSGDEQKIKERLFQPLFSEIYFNEQADWLVLDRRMPLQGSLFPPGTSDGRLMAAEGQ